MQQQESSVMNNDMPTTFCADNLPGASDFSNLRARQIHLQSLQEFSSTRDGRALTQDELKMKAVQLKRTIDAEKRRTTEMQRPTTEDGMEMMRNLTLELQAGESLYAEVQELLLQVGMSQLNLNKSQQQQRGQETGDKHESPLAAGLPTGFTQQQHKEDSRLPITQQQGSSVMNNGMPNTFGTGNLTGAASNSSNLGAQQIYHQGLQEFMRTKDGRALTQDELKLKAIQLGRELEAEKQRFNEMQKPTTAEGVAAVRNMMLKHSARESLYARVQQLLLYAGTSQPYLNRSQQKQPGQENSDNHWQNQQASTQQSMTSRAPMHSVVNRDAQDIDEKMQQAVGSREEFTNSLWQWYQARGLQPDPSILVIGTRHVMPYDLFSEVIQLGGFLMVQRHGLWNVIAVKLGWPQYVTGNDSSKQPVAEEVGKRLKLIYERLLEGYERDTVQNTVDSAYRQQSTAPSAQPAAQSTGSTVNANAGPPVGDLNALLGQVVPNAPPSLVNMPVQSCLKLGAMSYQTIEELQKRNIPGDAMDHIRNNKAFLQNFLLYCQSAVKKQRARDQLMQAQQ